LSAVSMLRSMRTDRDGETTFRALSISSMSVRSRTTPPRLCEFYPRIPAQSPPPKVETERIEANDVDLPPIGIYLMDFESTKRRKRAGLARGISLHRGFAAFEKRRFIYHAARQFVALRGGTRAPHDQYEEQTQPQNVFRPSATRGCDLPPVRASIRPKSLPPVGILSRDGSGEDHGHLGESARYLIRERASQEQPKL
jgi:hypothetical protein